MTQLCELTQIGRVGAVKEVRPEPHDLGGLGRQLQEGRRMGEPDELDRTTVFGRRDKMKDWALDTLQKGDLIYIRSTPSQTTWEKDSEKQYGYTMAVTELKLLTAKSDLKQRGSR